MSVALFACEKDEDRLKVDVSGEPSLSASTTSPALSQEDADETAITFNWNALELSWSDAAIANEDAVEYTLQMDLAGGDFTAPVTSQIGSATEKAFTVEELNRILGNFELPAGEEASLDVRLMASLGANVAPVYSNTITINATPYLDLKEYPSLYVPGSYQDWKPELAPVVASVKDNGIYEGYFYFPGTENKFKFTPERNWDVAHGTEGTATTDGNLTSGKLVIGGGDDIIVNGEGYYLLTANTKTNTWSARKTTWGVIGDATAGGWDADQDLTFDPSEQVWRATLPLKAGGLKFRANDSWDINYGDKNLDGFLDTEDENNIPITEAGTYEVTLNLSVGGNYRYTLKKQ